jgi:hypothetical protein
MTQTPIIIAIAQTLHFTHDDRIISIADECIEHAQSALKLAYAPIDDDDLDYTDIAELATNRAESLAYTDIDDLDPNTIYLLIRSRIAQQLETCPMHTCDPEICADDEIAECALPRMICEY